MDSGLPHDDITPRSDSLSTASSSASPPDQHYQNSHHLQVQQHPLQHQALRETQQEHRKSTSLDDINVAGGGPTPTSTPHSAAAGVQWKSSSLQRGMVPPSASSGASDNPIYGTVKETTKEGTVVIRRKTSRPVQAVHVDDEDPYGRCLNMKLTSFTDEQQQQQQQQQQMQEPPRDPRIIDLNLTTSAAPSISSQSASLASTPRQGSPVQFQQQLHPHPNGFNTLPVNGSNYQNGGQMAAMANGAVNGAQGVRMMSQHQESIFSTES